MIYVIMSQSAEL